MMNPFIGIISRIIMISPHKNNPIVCVAESVCNRIINQIVVAGFLEAKATISGNNKQCVRTSVLYAQFKYECFEVSMDISGDNYLFSVRIFIVFHFVVKKLVINFAARQ